MKNQFCYKADSLSLLLRIKPIAQGMPFGYLFDTVTFLSFYQNQPPLVKRPHSRAVGEERVP